MDKLFSNMLPYEKILIIMGMIFFLVLLFLMIWNVIKKSSITMLLPFFLIPIIMVAYPTIQSIKIGDVIINVKNLTEEVNKNPADTLANKQLTEALVQLKSKDRVTQNSNALITLANAQIALGKYDSASLYLNKADNVDPDSKEVLSTKEDLNRKIILRENFSRSVSQLNGQIDHLKKYPEDTEYVHQIVKTLSALETPGYVNPNELITIAKSYAIVGSKDQSLQIINKLNSSGNIHISNLKDSIQNQTYQDQFFKHTVTPEVNMADIQKIRLNQTMIRKLK